MTDRETVKQRFYPFVAHADTDGWHIFFPDLPGCQTFAESWDEVSIKARHIFEDWIDMLADQGREIPEPTIAEDELPWPVEKFSGGRLWTTAEAAKEIGVSVRRVRQIAAGQEVGFRQGRDIVFNDREIESMKVRKPVGRPR